MRERTVCDLTLFPHRLSRCSRDVHRGRATLPAKLSLQPINSGRVAYCSTFPSCYCNFGNSFFFGQDRLPCVTLTSAMSPASKTRGSCQSWVSMKTLRQTPVAGGRAEAVCWKRGFLPDPEGPRNLWIFARGGRNLTPKPYCSVLCSKDCWWHANVRKIGAKSLDQAK